MAYEHDDQARHEAARYALSGDQIAHLRPLVESKRSGLGSEGVRGHRVTYDPADWEGLIPPLLAARNSVSRGDVFDLAQTGDLTAVFAAAFLWGTGDRGYGPHRYREIVASTNGRLGEILAAVATATADDVIAGYTMFFGGDDPKRRAAPNTEPWARIDGYGPAFFTKFLYFTNPRALILDKVLATRVTTLSKMPYLTQPNGQSYAWSPYRYAVYLHWMYQTAASLGCTADELELTLFAPPQSGLESKKERHVN
jgi:hypothetical protein